MTTTPGTAVLILLDTEPGGAYPAPGGITSGAEISLLVSGNEIIRYTRQGSALALPSERMRRRRVRAGMGSRNEPRCIRRTPWR